MTFFIEGQEAAWRGDLFSSCPYKQGTIGYTYWRNGYASAMIENAANRRAA